MADRAVGSEQVLALLVGGVCAALGVVLGLLAGYSAAGLAVGAVLGAVLTALLHRPDERGRIRE